MTFCGSYAKLETIFIPECQKLNYHCHIPQVLKVTSATFSCHRCLQMIRLDSQNRISN